MDQQVKIGGVRIEPGEVEAALRTYLCVKETVVLVRPDRVGKPQLVAFVVASDAYTLSVTALRRHLQQTLPLHMIPTVFVQLAALPLTPNGKVDRQALPALELAENGVQEGARTPLEELLTGLWSEILDRPHIGIYEHFFMLGGHSLLATRLIARVRAVLSVEVPLRAVFEAPTVAEFAQRVEQTLHEGQGIQIPLLAKVTRPEHIPLSFAQQRLWFLDQLEAGSTAYLVSNAYRLHGSRRAVFAEKSARIDSAA